MTEPFPLYFNDRGRCVRRDSNTTGYLVEIPEEGKISPAILCTIITPTRERFDESIKEFQLCTKETFDNYLAIYLKLTPYRHIRKRQTLTIKS